MRIVRVSVLEYARQLDGRSWNPSFRWTERRAPLVVIEADNGVAGIGEAWSRQAEIGLVLAHLADVVAPRLPGVEISGAESIARIVAPLHAAQSPDRRNRWIAAAAASAIDLALWDLHARALRLPLWRALGGTSPRVRVYASGGLYRDGAGIDELAADMRGHVAAGFRAVKMKVGALPLAADLERVRAVRAAVGPDVMLWVDAVNQLPAAKALRCVAALREAGAQAIQAPVPFDDLETMAAINRDGLPVVAGEAEHALDGFDALLAAGAVSLLQPCLGLCGGFSVARIVADHARRNRIGVTPQTFGTAVMQAASLHWGAATLGIDSVEYHRFHDHLASLLSPALRAVDDGLISLDEEPGLGCAIPAVGRQEDGGEIRRHCTLTRPVPAAPA